MLNHRWVQAFDINAGGVLFGGRLLEWVDADCTLAASLECEKACKLTTAAMDCVTFLRPAKAGERLRFAYDIVHVGRTSLTIFCEVYAYGLEEVIFRCYTTLVRIKDGRPASLEHMLLADYTEDRNPEHWRFVEELRHLKFSQANPILWAPK
jgi:acyl-CoA hydrolase